MQMETTSEVAQATEKQIKMASIRKEIKIKFFFPIPYLAPLSTNCISYLLCNHASTGQGLHLNAKY